MIRSLLAALQLWVAPLLAAVFTLWSGVLSLATHDESGVPRILGPSVRGGSARASLSPGRSLQVVHLALLALAAALAGVALSWWAWPVPLALTRFALAVLLVWIVGELVPRLGAAIDPGLVRFESRFVQTSLALFGPFLALVGWLERGFRARRRLPRPAEPTEREMLTGILSLAEMRVAEVMTPRLDLVTVDFSASRDQLVETFRRSEHSRLLVVDGDPDSVTGVAYAKDLLPGLGDPAGTGTPDWHPLIRPVGFVPEGKTLDRQLRDFQRSGSHLVVVVDEFGGTSGIVTLEDVLEQIVGEIRDEYDTDEVAPLQRAAEGTAWTVQGEVALADLESELGEAFGREDVSTVGGLVLSLFGRVPRAGESVAYAGFRFTVDQVVRRRIRRVTVGPLPERAAVAGPPAHPPPPAAAAP